MTGDDPARRAGAGATRGRREMTYAVVLCLAGAGLALWAATRIWAVDLTARPAPLPPVRQARTGGDLLPWLPALAMVALAGAGAVLATRGRPRRLVGLLLAALGGAVAAAGGHGMTIDIDGDLSRHWPAFCLIGGVLTLLGGLWTGLRGNRWPSMGERYERPGAVVAGEGDRSPVPARRGIDAWDALDRGQDPTVS